MSMSNKFIVAAIDFGTTFSGYAFSFRHDYEKEPTKIQTNQWIGGGHISLKAPTCVLFKPDTTFHSFGYEAEDKYTELADDGDHKHWYYFRRFKMMLHNNKALSRKTLLYDEHKKSMDALTVFSASIKYLCEHLMGVLGMRVDEIEADDIHWVLTLPAIWNDSAKQFMRLAATMAGIKGDKLSLALEPEAASFLCKALPVERATTSSVGLNAFRPGTSYIVLDLGGGTVDITVHKVQPDGNLSEIAKASGGAWGGTRVDQAFLDMLISIAGQQVIDTFTEEYTGDYLDMMREFEVKKRTITDDKTGNITMRIPSSFGSHYKTKKKQDINKRVGEMPAYNGKISFKKDKVQIDADIFKSFFSETIQTTIAHVKEILQGRLYRNIDVMLLVGGFAESGIVQTCIKKAFPHKRFIIPNDSGLVVLKGAVLFGHNPNVMKSRVSKYTYGTEVINAFIEGEHRECYKVFENGYFKCRYLFEPFVRAGEEVPVDKVVAKRFRSDTFDVEEGVGIYASPDPNPMYCTERGCIKLGVIFLEEARHETLNEMYFGGTEFTMQITDLDTGIKRVNCFDFLTNDL